MARGKGLFHSPFDFSHKIMRFPLKGKAQTLGGTDEAIRTLVENINDLFYTTDTEGVVTYISPVVKTMIGYEPRDIIGRPLWDIFSEEDAASAKEDFKRTARSGRFMRAEYRVVDKSGKTKWIRTSGKPAYSDNKIIGLRAVATDITRLKWAEERLSLLSQAVEGSSEGIALSDLEGNLLYVNKAFAELHGCEPEEVIGKPLSTFHTPEQMPVVEEAHRQVRNTGKFIGEIWHARRDGSVFPGLMHNSLLRGSRGRPIGVMATLRDISDLKEAEEAMRENQAELERRVKKRTADLMRAKEELTQELKKRKQAMNELITYQERLRSLASELTLTEERERQRIATYLHDNVGHALAMAKMKLDNVLKSLTSLDAMTSLGEVEEMIKSAIEEVRSLTFELSPPVLHELGFVEAVDWLAEQFHKVNGIACRVTCDELPKPLEEDISIFLFHSVRELMVNVAKHSKAWEARITIERDNGNIRIMVEDNGIGFPVSNLDSYLQENGGFGLFSIRERFESIGGSMKIESEPGNGCSVTLVAPLSDEA
ncbi:MAG: PAS domain S-box protein [Deltaproteobacteria bacterium]|nr:PAS domain S-box protein [Deltaproteobacteria bacterium]MBW2046090.1 PAS domain S-box protein [Deltaproteobacteria bacterium]MBW2301011.1 PAS domain S-box protein [Deltaproteobacteria bacterium]